MIETKEDAIEYLRQGDTGSDILTRLDQLTQIIEPDQSEQPEIDA